MMIHYIILIRTTNFYVSNNYIVAPKVTLACESQGQASLPEPRSCFEVSIRSRLCDGLHPNSALAPSSDALCS